MTKGCFTERVSELIRASGKLQREIAQELGYSHANLVSMINRQRVKVPREKVPALARALGADPALMVRLYMEEHELEQLEAIRSALGEILSEDERRVLKIFRRVAGGRDLPADALDGLSLM